MTNRNLIMEPQRKSAPGRPRALPGHPPALKAPRPAWLRTLGLTAGVLAAGAVSAVAFALLWPGGSSPAARSTDAAGAAAPALDTPAGAAREWLARAGAGDAAGARALRGHAGPADDRLSDLARMQVRPLRGAPLPGAGAEAAEVLLWSGYRRGSKEALGYFQLRMVKEQGGWRVAAADGPVAPRDGWGTWQFPAEALDGQPVTVRGPAVLWAPRRPDADLAQDMAALHQRLGSDLPVVLVIDLSTPAGWEKAAREAGWQGPVWRVRGRVEELPVPALWPYKGAQGVLLDADNRAVAPLGALDPGRYNAPPDWPASAVQAVRAHGLIDRK